MEWSAGFVSYREEFDCLICYCQYGPKEGVVLRDCLHVFCIPCLRNVVKHSAKSTIQCPFKNDEYECEATIQQREIRQLLDDASYAKYLEKSLKEGVATMNNVFHCETPDCIGVWAHDDTVQSHYCQLCKNLNCLRCKVRILSHLSHHTYKSYNLYSHNFTI